MKFKRRAGGAGAAAWCETQERHPGVPQSPPTQCNAGRQVRREAVLNARCPTEAGRNAQGVRQKLCYIKRHGNGSAGSAVQAVQAGVRIP